MAAGEFDHTNWSDHRLAQREADLEATQKLKHNAQRMGDIALELACIRFEKKTRENILSRREQEIAWLEHDAREDTDTQPIPIIDPDEAA